MGQYWKPVNLDKQEYLNPHALGCGLKQWEQVANHPSTGSALLLLLSAMPERRGGGDLDPEEFPVIGRWAGDRVVLVGDYAEDEDLKNSPVPLSQVYHLCQDPPPTDPEEIEDFETVWSKEYGDVPLPAFFTDITPEVAKALEDALDGKFQGEGGWKRFVRNGEEE